MWIAILFFNFSFQFLSYRFYTSIADIFCVNEEKIFREPLKKSNNFRTNANNFSLVTFEQIIWNFANFHRSENDVQCPTISKFEKVTYLCRMATWL